MPLPFPQLMHRESIERARLMMQLGSVTFIHTESEVPRSTVGLKVE